MGRIVTEDTSKIEVIKLVRWIMEIACRINAVTGKLHDTVPCIGSTVQRSVIQSPE